MKTYKKSLIFSLILAAFFLLANVAGATLYYNLSVSQSNVYLSVGQTTTVTVYNNYSSSYYGTLYIYNNSNSNIATAYISGNTVSIYGNSSGSSNITVCQGDNNYYNYYNSNNCGMIYVTVSGNGYYPYNYNYNQNYYNNNSGLNISSLSLPVGGSATVSSANYSGMYVSNNSNPSVATASNSSILPTYNQYYNSSYIPGCMAGYVYSITTGQLCSGQGYNYYNYNNNGYYNYNYNSGSSVQILAVSAGSNTVTLCQGNGNNCSTVYITVY